MVGVFPLIAYSSSALKDFSTAVSHVHNGLVLSFVRTSVLNIGGLSCTYIIPSFTSVYICTNTHIALHFEVYEDQGFC